MGDDERREMLDEMETLKARGMEIERLLEKQEIEHQRASEKEQEQTTLIAQLRSSQLPSRASV